MYTHINSTYVCSKMYIMNAICVASLRSAVGGKAWYTLFAHAPKYTDIPVIQVYTSATELLECREIRRMREQCVPDLPSPRGRPGNEASYVWYV